MLYEVDHLSIVKRDADCYDVTHQAHTPETIGSVRSGRIAALRSDFTEDKNGVRTMVPGTWRIRWEHKYAFPGESSMDRPFAKDIPEAIEKLRFNTVHEAFAFFCSQVLV